MPPRDPSQVQADFPQLVADLIDQLQLTGSVGILDFQPTILPTFIVGSRGLTVVSEEVVYTSAQVFEGSAGNPAANAVIADTTGLPAGDYDVLCWIGAGIVTVAEETMSLQLRDAANAVTLAEWFVPMADANTSFGGFKFSIALALNERLRILNSAGAVVGRVAGTIMARRRLTP